MSDIVSQLNNFRSAFNKLMKMWRNYSELFDLVKKHYIECFKTTTNKYGNENDGLIEYITEYVNLVEPHLKYIKIHDDGIFTNDYIKDRPFEIFKYIDMKVIWFKLSKDDRKQTWAYIEKLYIIGKYITTEHSDLDKQMKIMFELYHNINQDKIVSETSKFLVDNKLSVTCDIDTSDLTDEDFLDENCVSFEDKVDEALDKLKDVLSSMKNGEQLGKLIIKIVKKIKFPKKLLEKLEHITEDPLSILKLITDKRIITHISGYMEKIKKSLTPEDLDIMSSMQNDENIFEQFQVGLEKLFNGVFTKEEIHKIFGDKKGDTGKMTVEQMEILKSKLGGDEKVAQIFEKTYKSYEKLKVEKEKIDKKEIPGTETTKLKQYDDTKTTESKQNDDKKDMKPKEQEEKLTVTSLLNKLREIDSAEKQ